MSMLREPEQADAEDGGAGKADRADDREEAATQGGRTSGTIC